MCEWCVCDKIELNGKWMDGLDWVDVDVDVESGKWRGSGSHSSYIALIINSYFYPSFHVFIIFTLIFTISYIIRYSYFIIAK